MANTEDTQSTLDDKLNALLEKFETVSREVQAQLDGLRTDLEATVQFFKDQRASE